MPQVATPQRRVFVYIDGFNLYYRRLQRDQGAKWLCVRTLANRLCSQIGQVSLIKFFTAKVDAERDPPTPQQRRQMIYWEALKHTNVEVIEGLLETRDRMCRMSSCGKVGRFPTEKMSDVNLALHIYRDYIEGRPDVIFVLSGDCDVLPALKMVRDTGLRPGGFKAMRVVCLPTDEDGLLFSRLPLHYQVARTVKLGESDIRLSPLPDKIEVQAGRWIERPDVWL